MFALMDDWNFFGSFGFYANAVAGILDFEVFIGWKCIETVYLVVPID